MESQGRLRSVHRLDHCHGDRADRAQCLRSSRTAARNVYSPRSGRLRNPVLGSVEGLHTTFEILRALTRHKLQEHSPAAGLFYTTRATTRRHTPQPIHTTTHGSID